MSIETFLTSITPNTQNASGGQTALGGQSFGQTGVSFAEFITEQLAGSQQAEAPTNGTANASPIGLETPSVLPSRDSAPTKETTLNIANLLAENPEIAARLESITIAEDASLTETLAFNQKLLDEVIRPLIEAANIDITAFDGAVDITQSGNALYDLGHIKIQDVLTTEDVPKILEALGLVIHQADGQENLAYGLQQDIFPSLNNIAADQIGQVVEQSADGQITLTYSAVDKPEDNNTKDEAGQDLSSNIIGAIAPIVQLVVPKTKSTGDNAALQNTVQNTTQGTSLPSQELASRLNQLVVGGDASGHALDGEIDGELEGKSKFENILGKDKGAKAGDANTIKTPNNAAKGSGTPNILSALENAALLFSSSDSFGLYPSVDPLSSAGAGTPITSLTALTDVITQSTHATRAHPATQAVAATIHKSAGGGQFQNLTLQLSPPELGRVEIRMEFGKQKDVKAQIVSEKPETHLMLQRDSSTMERILQDAGLDADGSLSFELAGEGYNFDQDGRHDAHAGHKGSGKSKNADESVTIETTMTWQVDPETGHMRYNILA